MFEHNGDDLVSQGYGAKREVPLKQSQRSEAALCYAESSEHSGGNHAAVLWLCVHCNLSEDTTKLLKFLIGLSQVSDGLIGMVRVLRLIQGVVTRQVKPAMTRGGSLTERKFRRLNWNE